MNDHFDTFSESWKMSGVYKTASRFSDVVLAAVPRKWAKQTGKLTSGHHP